MQLQLQELIEAYVEARRHKRNKRSAIEFECDLERNLIDLYRDLCSKEYQVSPHRVFVIEQPVKREVFAANFRDRVVHHLLMRRLKPHLEREFIYDSYSCREGKGTLFGVRRLRKFIAKCSKGYTEDCYILKCDIKAFFMSIDRDLLWEKLERTIRKIKWGDEVSAHNGKVVQLGLFDAVDKRDEEQSESRDFVLWLTKLIATHDPTVGCVIGSKPTLWDGLPCDKSLLGRGGCGDVKGNRGLPIGNLTSQWFANLYMNDFDHYIKHTLGVKFYGRYVDDFVIVDTSREHLLELKVKIERYLHEELHLTPHPKKIYLHSYQRGVAYLGKFIHGGALLTGRRTKGNLYRAMCGWNEQSEQRVMCRSEVIDIRSRLNSYLGLTLHDSGFKLRYKILNMFSHQMLMRFNCDERLGKVILRRIKQVEELEGFVGEHILRDGVSLHDFSKRIIEIEREDKLKIVNKNLKINESYENNEN